LPPEALPPLPPDDAPPKPLPPLPLCPPLPDPPEPVWPPEIAPPVELGVPPPPDSEVHPPTSRAAAQTAIGSDRMSFITGSLARAEASAQPVFGLSACRTTREGRIGASITRYFVNPVVVGACAVGSFPAAWIAVIRNASGCGAFPFGFCRQPSAILHAECERPVPSHTVDGAIPDRMAMIAGQRTSHLVNCNAYRPPSVF